MKEPNLFKTAQKQDKDGVVAPWLSRVYKKDPLTAAFLRGYISGLQYKIDSLNEALAKVKR